MLKCKEMVEARHDQRIIHHSRVCKHFFHRTCFNRYGEVRFQFLEKDCVKVFVSVHSQNTFDMCSLRYLLDTLI